MPSNLGRILAFIIDSTLNPLIWDNHLTKNDNQKLFISFYIGNNNKKKI